MFTVSQAGCQRGYKEESNMSGVPTSQSPTGSHEHTVVIYSQNRAFWWLTPALRPARSLTTTSASILVRLGGDTIHLFSTLLVTAPSAAVIPLEIVSHTTSGVGRSAHRPEITLWSDYWTTTVRWLLRVAVDLPDISEFET